MTTDGHLGCNFLKCRHGDKANAVLTAAGYNLRLILNWPRALIHQIFEVILTALSRSPLAYLAS